MIKKFIEDISTIDKSIVKVMKIGRIASFVFCIVALVILSIHAFNPISYTTYEIGTLLFKNGLFLFVDFFMCGFICDKLRKQRI